MGEDFASFDGFEIATGCRGARTMVTGALSTLNSGNYRSQDVDGPSAPASIGVGQSPTLQLG